MCKNAVCCKAEVPIPLRLHVGMFGWLVCSSVVNIPLKNILLIWRRHRASNFDVYSAFMAIEQWGFFCVPRDIHIYYYWDSNTQPSVCEANALTDYATTAAQGLRVIYFILNSAGDNLTRVSIYFQWCQFICASKLMKNVGFCPLFLYTTIWIRNSHWIKQKLRQYRCIDSGIHRYLKFSNLIYYLQWKSLIAWFKFKLFQKF